MIKPDNEMLFMVLEPKEGKNGTFYTGFLGLNSVHASLYQGKLFIKLQKWPKRDKAPEAPKDDLSFMPTEEDVPF